MLVECHCSYGSRQSDLPATCQMENSPPLTFEQTNQLLQLALRTYHEQARTCYKAKAYLASCIMAGAVVEAVLTAVTCYFTMKP
jgi:hypothetical protein